MWVQFDQIVVAVVVLVLVLVAVGVIAFDVAFELASFEDWAVTIGKRVELELDLEVGVVYAQKKVFRSKKLSANAIEPLEVELETAGMAVDSNLEDGDEKVYS